MTEEVQFAIDHCKEQMDQAMEHLDTELTKIRAGRANPSMLDSVHVDYYGSDTPLTQVSNVNTPDAKTISIQPWEKAMLEPIERAIINANLGLAPQNNGEMIIISIPALTEERRLDLVKTAKAEGEHAKVSLRNARHKTIDTIKAEQKNGLSEDLARDAEADVDKILHNYQDKIDKLLQAKEVDIMKV